MYCACLNFLIFVSSCDFMDVCCYRLPISPFKCIIIKRLSGSFDDCEPFTCFLFLQGKRLVFVTNNSTKSRKQYGKKFETLGLSVGEVSP